MSQVNDPNYIDIFKNTLNVTNPQTIFTTTFVSTSPLDYGYRYPSKYSIKRRNELINKMIRNRQKRNIAIVSSLTTFCSTILLGIAVYMSFLFGPKAGLIWGISMGIWCAAIFMFWSNEFELDIDLIKVKRNNKTYRYNKNYGQN